MTVLPLPRRHYHGKITPITKILVVEATNLTLKISSLAMNEFVIYFVCIRNFLFISLILGHFKNII